MPPNKARQLEDIYEAKAAAWALVKRNDEEMLWDRLNARDVQPEIIEYVMQYMEKGFSFRQSMASLGIRHTTDPRWKKIMSAIKQGIRIDTTGMFVRWFTQNENIANKLQHQIEKVLDHIITDENGNAKPESINIAMMKLNQNVSLAVDSLNRLRQGTVKLGKDLGIFLDPSAGGGGNGPQIIVQNNIALPNRKTLKEHQDVQIQKTKILIGKPNEGDKS